VTADLLLSEYFASSAVIYSKTAETTASKGGFKSETFDDYSYSFGDGASSSLYGDMVSLDIASLLDQYVLPEASGNTFFRMRKL